jgi:hypothetical protein
MSKDYEPYGPEWEAAAKLCPICKEVIDENLFCYKCRNA